MPLAEPVQAILAGYAHIHCIVDGNGQWILFRQSINPRVPVGGQARHSLRYVTLTESKYGPAPEIRIER